MYKYVILGIIQGLTEFLPVSSSGHLVIAQKLFGIKEDFIFLDVVLHAGTLLALVIFFYRDISQIIQGVFSRKKTELKTGLYILLATAVTAVIVYPGKSFFEGTFGSARVVAVSLAITGLVLLATRGFTQGKRNLSRLNFKDAILIGLAQAVAVIPGLSRSGLTISAGLFRNIKPAAAFKFSFLVSIPAIGGVLVFKLKEAGAYSAAQWSSMGAGFLAATLSGLLALTILKTIIQKAKFAYFGYYCLGIAILIWFLGKI